MTSVTRFGPALCVALVLHLHPATLRAGGDPPKPVEGIVARAQDSQGPLGNEIVALTIGVPQTSATLETSVSLLFLQPGSGNLMYGTMVNPFPFLSPHWTNQAVRPDFSPTFNVGTRYTFDGGGDIHVDWTHLNTYDSSFSHVGTPYALGQIAGPPTVQSLGPPFLIGPPVPFADALAVAHFAYDAVNLDAGLLLSLGSHVQVRPFVGLQWSRISESITANFRSGDLAFTDVSRSLFNGVGPRLGMEFQYIAGNLGLLGGIAGSTLIGTRQSNMEFFANTPSNALAGLATNYQYLTSPNSTQVIPCIDAKLAANYAMALGDLGVLKFEAGYLAAVYINAVNQYSLSEVENSLTADQPGTPETTGSAVFLRTAVETQSNFFVHGPFAKLAFQF